MLKAHTVCIRQDKWDLELPQRHPTHIPALVLYAFNHADQFSMGLSGPISKSIWYYMNEKKMRA